MYDLIPMEELVKFYSVSQATRILGISRQTLMKWIDAGKISNAKKEGDGSTDPWLLPAEEVERLRQERVRELDEKIETLIEQKRLVVSAKIELE